MLDSNSFAILVAFVALLYAVASTFIQQRLGNYKRIKEIQDTFKQLNDEFAEARKQGDKRKMEEVMKKQSESMPMLTESMTLQFKPLIVILAIFFLMTLSISFIEPLKDDDISLQMNDVGTGCDVKGGDGIYSACLEFNSTNYGAGVLTVEAFNGDSVIASNSTALFYNGGKPDDVFPPRPNGKMDVWSDKELYKQGDTASVYAKLDSPDPQKVTAKFDNGTFFFVDLPFTIPLLNISRIIGATGWFILCAVVLSIPLIPLKNYIR